MSFAPRDARCREMAFPIPRDPPVTIATRSWRVVVSAAIDSNNFGVWFFVADKMIRNCSQFFSIE
ncbi:hypothetical protein Hanom_Chr02g00167451 [Helianthus anomalus]